MSTPRTICVIGAGLMGHGIAYVMARAGHPVRVFDRAEEALASLPGRLAAIADLLGDDRHALDRITPRDGLGSAADGADLVIEAAAENLDVKQFIVAELEAVLTPEAPICSNTSALPIARIAAKAAYPERIVGTHFWNPPHLVRLVEVVQAARTSPATIAKTMAVLSRAGHKAVHVKKDVPGFIGNRLQHALKREAIAIVASGICDAETVDDVVKLGFGSRLAVLGPLEQSDLVGLNLTKAIHETIMPDIDRTNKPHPYLVKLVEDGKLGMATGEGFRKWTPEQADAVRARLTDFLASQAKT